MQSAPRRHASASRPRPGGDATGGGAGDRGGGGTDRRRRGGDPVRPSRPRGGGPGRRGPGGGTAARPAADRPRQHRTERAGARPERHPARAAAEAGGYRPDLAIGHGRLGDCRMGVAARCRLLGGDDARPLRRHRYRRLSRLLRRGLSHPRDRPLPAPCRGCTEIPDGRAGSGPRQTGGRAAHRPPRGAGPPAGNPYRRAGPPRRRVRGGLPPGRPSGCGRARCHVLRRGDPGAAAALPRQQADDRLQRTRHRRARRRPSHRPRRHAGSAGGGHAGEPRAGSARTARQPPRSRDRRGAGRLCPRPRTVAGGPRQRRHRRGPRTDRAGGQPRRGRDRSRNRGQGALGRTPQAGLRRIDRRGRGDPVDLRRGQDPALRHRCRRGRGLPPPRSLPRGADRPDAHAGCVAA